ncbi:MAG: ERCC4 domain-containing protein [Phycisphaerae bacterium]|nr:ERCC4 domain-containing protein [Phycisphaerae bacterium]
MTFQIVIDSREQEPYAFTCPAQCRKLEAGDYSVEGFQDRVAVERKSLRDFATTVVHDFPRFAAELKKLARMDAACVVVEADLDQVLRGAHGEALRGTSPGTLLGNAIFIAVHHGVPVYWCGSRQAARVFTEAFLRAFARDRAGSRARDALHV